MYKSTKNNQYGAGLLEILIFCVILLMVVQVTNKMFTNFSKFQRQKRFQISKQVLVSYLNDVVDCEQTLDPIGNSCTAGNDVDLESAKSHVFEKKVSKDEKSYTKIGDYLVRATCKSCLEEENCSSGTKISVEALLVNKKNNAVRLPMPTKSKWIELYDKVPFKCVM